MLKFALFALLCLEPVRSELTKASDNPIARLLNNYEPDIEPYEDRRQPAKPILHYQKNGVKIDVRVVPAVNDSSVDTEDRFPAFPAQELGRCILDMSISCFRDRMARFIDTISRLDEINLFGPGIKLVKTRALQKNGDRRMLDADGAGKIERSIDDFFDSFTLRISMPRMNGKRERNQIDVMFDDNGVKGRGKKGGGGGGGGKGCKKMMMMMLMMGKMKFMGMMSMKGMMMAGMSLMISKAMLIMKLMSLKKGGGGGGGCGGGGGGGCGGGGGGGGQLKEIVLLTKTSGGGGGGGGGGYPSDSYGAPPPSSYGPPSGGGGGYGGGGGSGWGRSFNDRISMSVTNDNQPRAMGYVSSDELESNPIPPEESPHFDDRTVWHTSNTWNPANPTEAHKQNMTVIVNSYNPKDDEFQALREPTSTIDKRIDNRSSKLVRAIYAKKWNNYEAADHILEPGTPMVAVRRTSREGRARKIIPFGLA